MLVKLEVVLPGMLEKCNYVRNTFIKIVEKNWAFMNDILESCKERKSTDIGRNNVVY